MSNIAIPMDDLRAAQRPSTVFAIAALTLLLLSALLAGFVPLGFAIVTVFIFAGPHNWFEFRYFLGRMSPRWGRWKSFYLTGLTGVLTLTGAYIVMGIMSRNEIWGPDTLNYAAMIWNSGLVLWVSTLVALRNRRKAEAARAAGEVAARADWRLPAAAGLLLVAGVWIWPDVWGIALVYIHPFIAFWFLDREIARSRPALLSTYRRCLLAIPVVLGVLLWKLAGAPPLPGEDMLAMVIAQHAGADVFPSISSHALVAMHTFLEMLHYSVWVIAIPLLAMRTAPWNFSVVPLARVSRTWKLGVTAFGLAGLAMVVILWGAFLANYPLTRDVYFTVAIGHVLAEATFLIKLL